MYGALLKIFANKADKSENTGSKDNTVILIIVAIVVLILLLTVGKKAVIGLIEKIRGNRFDKNAGSLENQWIMRLRASNNWYNDNENVVTDVLKEIATVKKFNEVSEIHRKAYGESLEKYLEIFLSANELTEAFSYLK